MQDFKDMLNDLAFSTGCLIFPQLLSYILDFPKYYLLLVTPMHKMMQLQQ